MTQLLQKTVERMKTLPDELQDRLATELQAQIDLLAHQDDAPRVIKTKRTFGLGKGRFTVPADFTDPLPDSFWLGEE
ncbi:MAG: prevent-host-death protein [Bacteroidota bacterium]